MQRKKSIYTLIKRLIAVEFLIATALVVSSNIIEIDLFRNGLIPYNTNDYNIISVLIISIIQIIVNVMLVMQWQREYYSLENNHLMIAQGFFTLRNKKINLDDIYSVNFKQSIFQAFFNTASLEIEMENGENYTIADVVDYFKFLNEIETKLSLGNDMKTLLKGNVQEIINKRESRQLEFKSTLRWDMRLKQPNKKLEQAVLKTIAGFMNAYGGILIIGIGDHAEVLGIEQDMVSLPKKNQDGFEAHVNNIFKEFIGEEYRQNIQFNFQKIGTKLVCIIIIKPGESPVYIKTPKQEEFFIRTGNATMPLSIKKATEYISLRWKK